MVDPQAFAEVLAHSVAGVASVAVIVYGALRGIREWRATDMKKTANMHVLPSRLVEAKFKTVAVELRSMNEKLDRIGAQQGIAEARTTNLRDRVVYLEVRQRASGE